MSRDGITAAVATKVESTVSTSPGYFIELQFPSGIVRHSSREQQTWNGYIWIPSTVKVAGVEGSGQRGQLEYFDADASVRTIVLADGVNDRRIRVWKFYLGALDPADPVLVFDGVGDGAKIARGRVTIGLARSGSRTLVTPRLRIGPGTGFNHLTPEGTVLQWAGRVIRLDRRRA